MKRLAWTLAALALVACSEEKSPGAADQSGTKKPTGGKPSVSNGGGGSMPGEGGVPSEGEAGTAICPPTGLFKRTSEMLDGTSDPRCRLDANAATTGFLGPITAPHTIVIDGISCAFVPDMISDDGCSRQRQVSCADGTTHNIQCDVQDDGTVRCTEQGEITSARCTAVTEYTPDSAWKGRCDGMWGPYTRTVEQTGDGADCPDVSNAEIGDLEELAIEPGCMLEFPAANGSCTVTAQEICDGGMGATHVCKVSTDSSMVTCTVTRGDCVYDVSLVR